MCFVKNLDLYIKPGLDYENLPAEMKYNLSLKLDYKTLIDFCKTPNEFLEVICESTYL